MPTAVVTLGATMAAAVWRLPLAAVTAFPLEAEAATLSRMPVETMGGDNTQTWCDRALKF